LGDAEVSDGDKKTDLTSAEAGRNEGTLLVNGGPQGLTWRRARGMITHSLAIEQIT
jgi:hypothetical protein